MAEITYPDYSDLTGGATTGMWGGTGNENLLNSFGQTSVNTLPAPINPGIYGLGGVPTVGQTFVGDPAGLWRTARTEALGASAALPQFQRTAMQGFTPAFGSYLLGGGGGSFGDYLTNRFAGTGGSQFSLSNMDTGATPLGADWQSAVAASRALNPYVSSGQLTPQQLAIQGALQGDNARANALAMAQAGLGGGIGYGAQMRQRGLDNLYDLYAARAAGRGMGTGGFLGYLGGLVDTGPNSGVNTARDRSKGNDRIIDKSGVGGGPRT